MNNNVNKNQYRIYQTPNEYKTYLDRALSMVIHHREIAEISDMLIQINNEHFSSEEPPDDID